MCQAPTAPQPKPIGPSTTTTPSRTSNLLRHASILIPPFLRHNLLTNQPPSKKKTALLLLVAVLLLSIAFFSTLYTFHRGFRRTIQFWRGLAPMALQYKFLKFKSLKIDRVDDAEYQRRIAAFRQRNAPQLVDLILSLGGIYVKIGQVMSTIGAGLLPDEYVRALRPLQDGVPPKDLDRISKIIEEGTGKKMTDLFLEFEERPVGSASIAQAHRAVLRPTSSSPGEREPQRVIVKVQYPEVAELFAADLANLEWATYFFAPENMEVAKAMRKRHENELDFRIEADNLRRCAADMQRHGVEPSLVRIPRVRNETGICSKNVLVMEYLEGMALSDVIQEEQERVARALGKEDAAELKRAIMTRMRDHFERGGGAGDGGMNLLEGAKMNLLSKVLGPAGGTLLRAYASARNHVEDAMLALQRTTGKILAEFGGKKPLDLLEDGGKSKAKRANVNLSKALKTLVHVHGIQFMISGVYNADPHPGNVLVLPDGRLGLLDYGMVGKLSRKDRQTVAELILALNSNDKATAARIYRENGYKATLSNGLQVDDSILHRLATFHLDKIDLSKLTLDNGDTIDVLELLRGTRERAVPSWVEEGRRLGGLLQGVCVQAARPISLAKEWSSIAKDALKQK
ncbi:hypothetical protein ACHAWX_002675 [Stephanocyclus meneghinianus]